MNVAKIKELKAKDEDELLDLVTLWPKFDEKWHKEGEWIEPKDKATSTRPKTVTKRKRAYRTR